MRALFVTIVSGPSGAWGEYWLKDMGAATRCGEEDAVETVMSILEECAP